MLIKPVISVVVPVYNEATIIHHFHQRLSGVIETLSLSAEILYVNDGSTDHTLSVLHAWQQTDPRITVVDLSRNFGKEIALSAGLDHSQGEAVIVIDADLQHPPELIPSFMEHWRQGSDVVYAKRLSRKGETWLKKFTAQLFYRLLDRLSIIKIPVGSSDFRLLSRRTVEALKQCRETHRFMKGLFTWVGYKQTAVSYECDPRVGGQTKWNYPKLLNLAVEGITSFSIAPLRFATYFGFLAAFLAFIYALLIMHKTFFHGEPVQGYPSLMVVILFLGGIQLVTLGIIGEYLGRTFDEVKRRPLYLINDYKPASCFDSRTTNASTT
jgi:glycosyltransferase involved in cell wall biosynthesis